MMRLFGGRNPGFGVNHVLPCPFHVEPYVDYLLLNMVVYVCCVYFTAFMLFLHLGS